MYMRTHSYLRSIATFVVGMPSIFNDGVEEKLVLPSNPHA